MFFTMCMFKTHTCLNYFPSGFTNNFTAAITNKMEETDLTMWSSKTVKNQRTLTIGLGGDICISMADLCWCTAETNMTL